MDKTIWLCVLPHISMIVLVKYSKDSVQLARWKIKKKQQKMIKNSNNIYSAEIEFFQIRSAHTSSEPSSVGRRHFESNTNLYTYFVYEYECIKYCEENCVVTVHCDTSASNRLADAIQPHSFLCLNFKNMNAIINVVPCT